MIRYRLPSQSLKRWLTDSNRYDITAERRVRAVIKILVPVMIHRNELTYAATPSVTLSIRMIMN